MIGDIFYFSKEGCSILANSEDENFLFYTIEPDKWPRGFYVRRTEKIHTAPLRSMYGCFCNERKVYEKGDIVYIVSLARVKPYRFEAYVNPDGLSKVKLVDKDGIVSYHNECQSVSYKHKFEQIEGTKIERCKDCDAIRTQLFTRKYKPFNKVPLSKRIDSEFSL